ncbi:MAG: MFS transporter [Alphaproteobacteria bacterium]|jgi:predicted MFS family arabinose efflux permease
MARFVNLDAITTALKQRNFAWYFAGSSIGLIGIWGQRLTISWLAWEFTRSGFWLGVVVAADLLPTIFFAPIAGVVADRVNRHRMMFVTQFLGMLQALTLAALAFSGLLDIWCLVGLTMFIGIVWAFNTAARLSMVPNLLEPQHVPSAVAMDSAIFNLARFIGPMVAGYLIAGVGAGPTFLINGITFAVFLVCLLQARMIRDERGARSTANILVQATEGIRYAVKHPGIRPVLILIIALAIGIKPTLELLAGVTDTVYNLGPTGLGNLMAASAVGATIAAVWLAQRGTVVGMTRIVISALLLGIVSLFAFTATQSFVFGLVCASFIGAAIVVGGTGTQTLMQNAVDGAMRGRVMSLYGMVYRGGPALGAFAMGSAAEFIGFQSALACGGVIGAGALVWVFRQRKIMVSALEGPPDNGE